MFFFIPYRSDVAARQFVWGTVGVIAANIAVALVLGFPSPRPPPPGTAEFIDHWVLHFGTINPLTWITSAFAHFSWIHLGCGGAQPVGARRVRAHTHATTTTAPAALSSASVAVP